MYKEFLKELLHNVKKGEISIDAAIDKLKTLPFEKVNEIFFDHHRILRKNIPEVIYGPGKEEGQLLEIVDRLIKTDMPLLITRVDGRKAKLLLSRFPELKYNARAKTISFSKKKLKTDSKDLKRGVLIITAGTSDLPVAEEAKECLKIMNIYCETLIDTGVAGIHRLFNHLKKLEMAAVIIVIAGMEGALPSIVAGIVEAPVIAVPTSVGYGSNLNGFVPLLTMLNSCAPGIGVVNIDSGINAAFLAATIINTCKKISNGS